MVSAQFLAIVVYAFVAYEKLIFVTIVNISIANINIYILKTKFRQLISLKV